MATSKIVDDVLVTLDRPRDITDRSCFVVFSSREKHVEIVIDSANTVFENELKYNVLRLDSHLKSGDSQHGELLELLSHCCFAIVVLDGFRPNVLLEYGILKGLGKPTIVLLEETACVDIAGFYADDKKKLPDPPPISMDKHLSDVKDLFYVKYDRNNPVKIREMLREEHRKLEDKIEDDLMNSLFPHREYLKKELTAHLTVISDAYSKTQDELNTDEITKVGTAQEHVERIALEYGINLPQKYFTTLSQIYERANIIERAIVTLDSAISGNLSDVYILNLKARILWMDEKLDEALVVLSDGMKLDPKAVSLRYNKAMILDELGNTQDARDCFEEVIDLHPDNPEAHYRYGILLYQNDDFASALVHFDKAIEFDSDEWDYRLWKARAMCRLDKVEDATEIVSDLIKEDPANADAWFVLGTIEADSTKSLDAFQRAVELDPKHGGALCSSASCLSNLGRPEEAIKIFERIGELCPKHERCQDIVRSKCITLERLDRADEGVKMCNKLLSTEPDHLGALEGKVICIREIGSSEQVIEACNDVLRVTPVNLDMMAEKAWFLEDLGRSNEAMECFDEAIEIDPDHHRVLSYKAEVLTSQGRGKEAIVTCDRLLSNNPHDHKVLLLKSVCHNQLAEYDAALTVLDAMLTKCDPRSPLRADILYYQACTYALMKKASESVRCLKEAIALDGGISAIAQIDPHFDGVKKSKSFRDTVGNRGKAPIKRRGLGRRLGESAKRKNATAKKSQKSKKTSMKKSVN